MSQNRSSSLTTPANHSIRPHTTRVRVLAALMAAGGLASGLPCLAQSTTAKPTPKPAQGISGVTELSDEPYRLDSVGLSVRLPMGANAESTRIGGRTSVQVVPTERSKTDRNWIINIQTPVTTKDGATIAEAMEKTISLIQGSYGIVDKDQQQVLETQAQMLDRVDDLKLPGGDAARFYVSIPRGDGSRLVKGYTIFKPSAKQYVVFEFITGEKDFPALKSLYETTVGTAAFSGGDAMTLARGSAVKAGSAFMQQLSDQDYAAALSDKEVWYRLYRPAKTGATSDADELGYRGVKFWHGQRGEVNPAKPKAQWSKADQQDGYLAQVRGRILLESGVGDTLGTYFMTPDRNEECWTITTVFKDTAGKQIASATETGARMKDEMTIVKDESGKPLTHIKPPIMGEGYVSQLETFLLPRLMVSKKIQADLGFYAYQSSPSGTISFRKDSISNEGALWKVVTYFREDSPPQVSTYNEKGDLLKTTLDDGRSWEPVDLTALKRLWQQKGLPVDR